MTGRIKQRNKDIAIYATPYKFNGKELDEETGLYYYGARYLHPKYAMWLSTDPLEGTYPNVSSYTYCHDNPIIRKDRFGLDDYTINLTTGEIDRLHTKDKTHSFYISDAKNIYRGFNCDVIHDDDDPPYGIYAYNSRDTVAYTIHNMGDGENNFIIDYAHFKDTWFELSGVTVDDDIDMLWNRLDLVLQKGITYNHIDIVYDDSITEKNWIARVRRGFELGISLILDLKDNIITDIFIYPEGSGQELYCKLPETCWIGYIKNAE